VSIRVIATIGVMLSVAVTSFSIYLGVVEHAYSVQTREVGYARSVLCFQQHHTSVAFDATNLARSDCGAIDGPHR
jgi:hypothetical protein